LYDAALKSFQSGRLDAAERRCRKALSAEPTHADSLHLLGLIYAATNRLDLGIESVAQAVRHNPANPEYFLNLGTLLQRQSRFDEAFKSYDLALKLKPDFVAAWIKLGDLLTKQKRFDEALLTYGHALTLDGESAEAANKSARLLKELRRHDEALARFALLAKISPDNAEAFRNMAVCLWELKRPEEAVPCLQKVLEIDAGNLEARNDLGTVLLDLHRFEEAAAHFYAALEINSDFVAALNNLGVALTKLGRFDEALPVLDRVIALKPDYAGAHYNRGNCLDGLLRGEEASSSFRKALALDPNYLEAHLNLAVNRLRAGDFKTGWIESEWRWDDPAFRSRKRGFTQPPWLGREPIEGKTLLLYNEQGLGDALQFCRYAPLAAARGARVVIEVEAPLRELFHTMEGASEIIVKGEALPDFDTHCPLISLPLAFGTTLDTIPSTVPYLSVAGHTRDWQAWLGARKGPRIGLVWSGNPTHPNDHNRSIALEMLLPLLDVGAQFVSLQKDVRPGDAAILRTKSDIRDAGPELKNFTDTAALLSQIDLLITVDTSVAHLAGALGRPAWVLLPRLPEWRWLIDREDSPWYPSLRLFRQIETATWPPVVQRVKDALRKLVAS
jgi:tetratricopeptide (TPR) repeat protein